MSSTRPNAYQPLPRNAMLDGDGAVWTEFVDISTLDSHPTDRGNRRGNENSSTNGYGNNQRTGHVEYHPVEREAPEDRPHPRSSSEAADQARHVEEPRSDDYKESAPATWRPYTFLNMFLFPVIFIAFALSLASFLLLWRSQTNHGLGNDDGSSGILFGWRYSPTLVTILYVQLTAMLLNDVKRTESFARLARPDGAVASASILQATGAWWNALRDGFSKKKNGSKSRSWILIAASLVNIVGFLAISPLSSTILASGDVNVPRMANFQRQTLQPNSPLPVEADRNTRFRTIAHLLRNVSTSPWITDDFTVLPFWPAGSDSTAVNSLPRHSSQEWRAETTVFKSDLNCTQMLLEDQKPLNESYLSAVWSFQDGCQYGVDISYEADIAQSGGAGWSNMSSALLTRNTPRDPAEQAKANHTAACGNREVMLMMEPFDSVEANIYTYLCQTTYWMANVSALVTFFDDEPSISIDDEEYQRNKVMVPETVMDTTKLQSLSLGSDWPSYMLSLMWNDSPAFGGLGVLLGALYQYNITSLLDDPHLFRQAAKVKGRFLGEVVMSGLSHPNAAGEAQIDGTITTTERRVAVLIGPAIAIGVLFCISGCLLLLVWGSSRLTRRPLLLQSDPATTAGVAFLAMHDRNARREFEPYHQSSRQEFERALEGKYFRTKPSGLVESTFRDSEVERVLSPSEKAPHDPSDWVPFQLRRRGLITLIGCLVLVIIAIALLYHFADQSALYQKMFVYQADIFSDGLGAMSPFAMVPTAIGVGIGLWWSAIDEQFRRLQPFIAMSQGCPSLPGGISLSYQSSYWVWAATKAVMNKHWLLSLVTFGSSLSPILSTTMSALFVRSPGDITESITLQREVEIRQIPFVYNASQTIIHDRIEEYAEGVLMDITRDVSSHWMFTAPIQLTLDGPEPAWSKDGWSFVPLDLSKVTNEASLLNTGQSAVRDSSQLNVSFTTPAIRGSIECSPEDGLKNLTSWLSVLNLTGTEIWANNSPTMSDADMGFLLGAREDSRGRAAYMFTPGYTEEDCPGCTTILPSKLETVCCANENATSVGYWSPNVHLYPGGGPRHWQRNFTTKWITGPATSRIQLNESFLTDDLIFVEPPSVARLNCHPQVEVAHSEITINPHTGIVQAFRITDTPQVAEDAFASNFLIHNDTIMRPRTGYYFYNTTVSYGNIFTTTMFRAMDVGQEAGPSRVAGLPHERLEDNTYNFRDRAEGLNMDFMTYSMYMMADKDPTALLDPKRLEALAQKTFTTFFQHYASNNLSTTTGGWVYQPINASLPADLAPVVNESRTPNEIVPQPDFVHPIPHTDRAVVTELSRRIELLHMNRPAVWISISILALLLLTTVVVAVLQQQYFGSLIRNVDCLGDVLILVAKSDKLMQTVSEMQTGQLTESDLQSLRTRLGWFVDRAGEKRWGIEMDEMFTKEADASTDRSTTTEE